MIQMSHTMGPGQKCVIKSSVRDRFSSREFIVHVVQDLLQKLEEDAAELDDDISPEMEGYIDVEDTCFLAYASSLREYTKNPPGHEENVKTRFSEAWDKEYATRVLLSKISGRSHFPHFH